MADGVPTPPPTANTQSIGPLASVSDDDKVVPRKQVVSWAFWDWATQPFNSVILTFVFAALYLVGDDFLPAGVASLDDDDPLKVRALAELSSGYGVVTFLAGILILLLAPVLGQRADATGRKKGALFLFTMLLALLQFALFFVQADPSYFWLGAAFLALGAVVSEIAGVNYNAMLHQVSNRRTIGKVSGLGWGLGYIGGIVALAIVVVLNTLGFFGLDNGLGFRLVGVGAAVWTIVFSIPIFLNVPESPPHDAEHRKVNFFAGYVLLVKDLNRLRTTSRPAFWFLFSSAIYRDGLAGIFAFAGVLATAAFGFGATEVILFAIVANVVAGISTIFAGRADDRFGPKAVIVFALTGLVLMAVLVFALSGLGSIVFWIGGIILASFVGPAQAASRSLLARVTRVGLQGEIFGLYATTGRVASFISPGLWALAIAISGSTIFGVLGIALVLLVGLILLVFVKLPDLRASASGGADLPGALD
ncbi:MAG: MFS transporter [Pseudolysinimonas sp.]